MANVLGELFQDIADAIRSKTGSTDTLKPNEFPAAIEGISAGGGSSADVRYVTFRNESTGEEYKKPVAYGDDCVDVVAKGLWKTPTKESTAQYNYTFYGWGASDGGAADANILKNITADKTVYAIFSSSLRTYTITFYDDDGTTVLATKQFGYGTVPSYTPTKEGAAFDRWTPTPVAVTGEASYKASWVSSLGSGSCGNNATWLLSADGVLTISGTGNMIYGYSAASYGWNNLRSQIREVVINEGITDIGAWSFDGCTNLTTITIPSSVTIINNRALSGCTSLSSITIPNGVKEIRNNVFMNCTGLVSITSTDSVTYWGTNVFSGCSKLSSVTVPNSLVKIYTNTFSGCEGLKSITIPASVTSIENAAFWNCNNLTSVTFEVTSGWTVYSSATATSGTSLSSSDLSNQSTAATYLRSTYAARWWKRA